MLSRNLEHDRKTLKEALDTGIQRRFVSFSHLLVSEPKILP